jgi:hypothetical protein
VDRLAARTARFYLSLHADFDIAFTDIADRDAGLRQTVDGDSHAWLGADDYRRNIRFIATFVQTAHKRVVLWQIPLGNTRMRAMDNTKGHYQDNKVEWLLGDPSLAHLKSYRDSGVVALFFGGGGDGSTCACDAQRDGVTNPPPVNGNDAVSLSADDDGGFFRQHAAAYYAGHPLPVP